MVGVADAHVRPRPDAVVGGAGCRLAQSVRRNKMSRVAAPRAHSGIELPRRQLFSTASFRPVNMVLQVAEARSASS